MSSEGSPFNYDFGVSFTEEPRVNGATYNFGSSKAWGEAPGVSVFAKRDGKVFHTDSVFGRGLEDFMVSYRYLDLVPKGRDEVDGMSWVKLRDLY